MERIASENWINEFSPEDRVLLINPPVQEVRYAWIKWNQPSDLLLLSSLLKDRVQCDVELLDFMLPMDSGRVPMRDLAKQKVVKFRDSKAEPTIYRTRTYGMALEEAKRNLEAMLPEWKPNHLVITTLTSYWFETLLTLVPYLRTIIPGAKVSLIGAYPVLESNHAMRVNPDYLVNTWLSDLSNYRPDFDIYFNERTRALHNGRAITFGGLKFTQENTVENLIVQIEDLRKRQIKDFVIFEGNLFVNECTIMDGLLAELERKNIKVNFHGLCGLETGSAVDEIFLKMRRGGFKSFFMEYDLDGVELNLDNYRRAYYELRDSRYSKIASGSLAGFIMVGTPQDELERMFKHCFNLLELFGSIIPKPYTPNPFSDTEKELYQRISAERLDFLSPHVFPMAEVAGISREDYKEFYKHTTFLNEKRMGTSFDFFDNAYSTVALKKSLGKKGGVLV